jgi:hypothetical protein
MSWKNLLWQRAANLLGMRSSLLESVIVTEFQPAETYSSVDLTKGKYSICRLSKQEKENIVRISLVISVHVEKKIDMVMKMKFAFNMYI